MFGNMLEKEFNYFIDNQDNLVHLYNGKHLVIKGETVVGVFNTEIDAYFDAANKFGLGNFLIQKCTSGKEAYTQTFHSRVAFV
jgi:hypothetical protein